jgi:hypothetical protein
MMNTFFSFSFTLEGSTKKASKFNALVSRHLSETTYYNLLFFTIT